MTHWISNCAQEQARPLANLENALLAVEHEWPRTFAYDEMLRLIVLMQSLDGANDFTPRPLTDVDVEVAQHRLQQLGLKRVARDTVRSAIGIRAHKCKVNPIRDYLTGLEWDGKPRVSGLFKDYFQSSSDPTYTGAIGRMFLVSMVARILEPGCKVDHLPIIEGEQGVLKSTACEILGGEYFSDHLPDIRSKDASQHLKGKWLIEVSEMHAMDHASSERLKAFITRNEERYRPSYGRQDVLEKRTTVFIGTTNRSVYLRDETGGRRFWPLKSGVIKLEDLKRDRDQLFAEAVKMYHDKVPWWPERDFEKQHIAPQQASRYESDIWEEAISVYLQRHDRVTVTQVAREAVKLQNEKISRSDQLRIMKSMNNIGWESTGKVSNGARWWVPKEGPMDIQTHHISLRSTLAQCLKGGHCLVTQACAKSAASDTPPQSPSSIGIRAPQRAALNLKDCTTTAWTTKDQRSLSAN